MKVNAVCRAARWMFVAAVALACVPVAARAAEDPVPADAPLRWWKGNLHTHTLWSDGDDFPEMVADWYRQKGYNFLGLSDHNVLSQGQRWMKAGDIVRKGGKVAIDKYVARFGEAWVETRGDGEQVEYRLKPLNEFRSLLEERGKFIMVQSEEITQQIAEPTDKPAGTQPAAEKRQVHMNVTNIREQIEPPGGSGVVDAMNKAVAAVEAQEKRTGQPMVIHLNHPNFRWGIQAEELAQVFNERFFEIYNGHPGVNELGDAKHESVERIWDITSVLRMTQLNNRPLMGLGVDDSHHYHVVGPNRSGPGRGWVMVRARHLTPESIVKAMRAGDFYASSGVSLKDVRFEDGTIKIEVDAVAGEKYTTRFVGTPVEHELMKDGKYSPQVGMTFATVEGASPSYKVTGKELYVRAIVSSDARPESHVWEGQVKQAWTQPVVPGKDARTASAQH